MYFGAQFCVRDSPAFFGKIELSAPRLANAGRPTVEFERFRGHHARQFDIADACRQTDSRLLTDGVIVAADARHRLLNR